MVEAAKKSGRSISRAFGQSIVTNPQTNQTEIVGAPMEVRFAYPFLHEKRPKSAGGMPLEKPRNDVVVLVPKTGPGDQCSNYRLLSTMLAEAAHNAWGSWPAGYLPNIDDGDIPHRPKPKPGMAPLTEEQIHARNAWRRGYWVIEAVSAPSQSPRVSMVQNGQYVDILAREYEGQVLYKSGDYGFIYMNAWTFEKNANFGVNFGLEAIAFTRPGELIGSAGGPKSAAQMFGSVPGGVAVPQGGTAPGPAPTMAPPPASPAPQYAAPVAPVSAPPAAPVYQAAPVAPPPGVPAAPAYAPPMPPVSGAPGLPPFPGR